MISMALEWASAVWDADLQVRSSFAYFAGMIREVFEYPAVGKDISLQLMELRQGSEAQSALIDSGAAVNLIDGALVEELGIPTFPCVPSLRITAIDSQPNGEGYLKHQTELLDFQGRIYPLSLPESKAMEDYIETTLAARHIRPSMSPVAAGFFFVGKRDGGLGPCIDYRGLNAITIRYPYPLPLVPAALEQLGDLLGKGVIAYIDNILVYSTSMEDHVRMLREVLFRLQQHHLYVKLEKCEFHWPTVTFLGYVISHHGVEMDMVKVQAVT
ncbi:hypothetical protein QTP70_026577 [Hemibagrus guttatus]|uniref:ribonuclease H n=1 Tax=Hemibagrus guttatus TaxID=175788 RepID=A0AAE0VD02_9TELE|nr:hypothetical protein QTP70_026577 [Hemibagrus guttatus]